MEGEVDLSDARCGLYLYCLFTGDGQPAELGIDDREPTQVLRYRELNALISEVPLAEFSGKAMERHCLDPHWLREKALHHDRVIRSVMQNSPVLPIRFGTLYTREERLRKLLASHYHDFRAFLETVTGAAEWGVKVYAGEHCVERPSAHAPAQSRAEGVSPGREYLMRKKMAKQQSAIVYSDHAIEQILERLSVQAMRAQRNKLLSRRATGMKKEMVLNAAFLVADDGIERFRKQLDELESEYRELGFQFQLSGPWAPYNFCPAVA